MASEKQMNLVMSISGRIDKMLPKGMADIQAKANGLAKDLIKMDTAQAKNAKLQNDAYKNLRQRGGEYARNAAEINRLNNIKNSAGNLSKEEAKALTKLEKENKKLSRTMHETGAKYTEYKARAKSLGEEHNRLQRELGETAREMKRTANMNGVGRVNSLGNRMVGKAAKVVMAAGAIGGAAAIYQTKQSVNEYLSFNEQMKKVQAVALASTDDFARLEGAALRAGASTKFTSTEAAQALEELSRSGKSVDEQIALLPKLLDLATASGESMQNSTKILLGTMSAFGMKAEEAEKAQDALAYVAATRKVDVNGLGEAMTFVGTKASLLGMDINETTAAIGMLGEVNLEGGRAGRNLASGLDTAEKKAAKFGIKLKDQKGNFVGMVAMLKQVEEKTKKMGAVQKDAYISKIFGTQGARTIGAMMKSQYNGMSGSEGLAAYIADVNSKSGGATKRMADIVREGAAGAVMEMKSALNNLQIIWGKIIMNPRVEKGIRTFSTYVGQLAMLLNGMAEPGNKIDEFWKDKIAKAKEFFGEVKNSFAMIWKIVKAVFTVINTLGMKNIAIFMGVFLALTNIVTAFQKIKEAGGILVAIKTGFTAMGGPITLIIAGVALLATGIFWVYRNWDLVKEKLTQVWIWIKKLWDRVMGFIDDISERFPAIGIAIEAVKTILDFSTWPFQALIAGVKGFFDQWDSSKGIVENIKNGFAGFFDGIFKFFETFAQRILDKIIEFAGKVKTGALQLIGIKGEDFIKNESSAAKALDSGAPLAKGSSFIPFDNFPAILHYGERVLTKRENEQYSGIFGNRVGSILGRAASAKSSTTSGSSGPTIKIGDRSDGGVTVSIGNITIGGNADSNIAMQIGQEVARQVARKLKEQKEATHDAKRRSF